MLESKGDEIYMAGWRWKRGTAGTPMKGIQIEKTDDTAALNRPVGGGIVFLMILEMGGWGGGEERVGALHLCPSLKEIFM
jgi:hypothetical protein